MRAFQGASGRQEASGTGDGVDEILCAQDLVRGLLEKRNQCQAWATSSPAHMQGVENFIRGRLPAGLTPQQLRTVAAEEAARACGCELVGELAQWVAAAATKAAAKYGEVVAKGMMTQMRQSIEAADLASPTVLYARLATLAAKVQKCGEALELWTDREAAARRALLGQDDAALL